MGLDVVHAQSAIMIRHKRGWALVAEGILIVIERCAGPGWSSCVD